MNKLSGVILIVLSVPVYGQDIQHYYTEAKNARERKDYENYYLNISEAQKLHPYHQVILYQRGIACALTGRYDEAISSLNEAISIDNRFDLGIEDLQSLAKLPQFQDLVSYQKELSIPVANSDTSISIPNKENHFESIAYHPESQVYYLGSINSRKIIKSDLSGKVKDFYSTAEMSSVFGIRIDSKKQILWACSSPMPEMENYDSTLNSVVYKFDLKTATLVDQFELNDTLGSVLGDLMIRGDGQVFVSDSKNNRVLLVNETTRKLELFYTSEEFWNLQGICFSTDNRFLFLSDYIKGLYQLELSSNKLTKLTSSVKYSLKGSDGLLFYNNSLIAIQNGVYPMRTMRYYLNNEKTSITRAEVIDWAHPSYGEPTIGQLIGDKLYYIANSQWNAYDPDYHFKKELAKDVVILEYQLGN